MAKSHPIPTDPRFKNLVGEVFGRLTVLEYRGRNSQRRYQWLCSCECGNETVVAGVRLNKGDTSSCGCLRLEVLRANAGNPRHGLSRTPEWACWKSMIQRCTNPKHASYRNYGGRSIGVCERWLAFENFYADMGPKPTPQYSLDRIANNKDYSPENCRWATRKEQAANRRDTRFVTFQGRTQPLKCWAVELGIPYMTLWHRILKLELSPEMAFSKSPDKC